MKEKVKDKEVKDSLEPENSLQGIEKNYRALLERAPHGILIIDPEADAVVEFNEIAHHDLGYSREEFLSLRVEDFEATQEPLTLQARNKKILQKGKIGFKTRFCTKKGDVRNVIVEASLIEVSDKKMFVYVYTDMLALRKVCSEIKKTEQKFLAITNSVKDAIVLVDEKAKVAYWNPAAEKIFGYTTEEALGKDIHELVVPTSMCKEGRERIETGVKTFNETGIGYFTVATADLVGRRKDGTEFPAKLSISPLRLDGKWNAVGVVKDITQTKKDEQRMLEAERRYHALFNQAPDGVLVIDPDSLAFIEFNDIAYLQLGYTREEFNKMTVKDIEAAEAPNRLTSQIKEILKEGHGEFETKHRTKAGEVRDILVTTRTVELAGKSYLHAFFRDITQSKEVQSQLAEYSQKLEQLVEQRTEQLKHTQEKLIKSERLATIGELAAMIGHDLRNPLTGIKNAAYYLEKKGASIPQDEAKEMLSIIDRCLDHSNRVVNDLLDYSREIHLELQECSPKALMLESLAMLDIPEKVEVQINVSDQPQVRVDPEKIKRVFVNLIKNALEAMENIGKITIGGEEIDGFLEVSVSDTGTGINDEVLAKLFSPLFTTKAQGMGFGLAICKRLIEAHGGTISVETAIGKGTTFKVTLPIEQREVLEVRSI
jgi:PAS domain S-box-containing protein